MAGDWLKMRTNLWEDPRVDAICERLSILEATAVGGLFRLWAIADGHSLDGRLPKMTKAGVDRKTGIAGFGEAVEAIGWVTFDNDGATIVRFDEHNGKSAKRRSAEARRKASARDADTMRTDGGQDAESERKECGARPRPNTKPESKSPPPPDGGGGARPARFDPLKVAIPPSLDTTEFREAWGDWCQVRREKKSPQTPTSARLALDKLAKYPAEIAVAAVRKAASNGHTGVYPEGVKPDSVQPKVGSLAAEASAAFDEAVRVILAAPIQDAEKYRAAIASLPERSQAAIKAMGGARLIRDMTDQNRGIVRAKFRDAYLAQPPPSSGTAA